MIVEIDHVAVDKGDWKLAKKGDKEARMRIRRTLRGVSCYAHNLSLFPDKYERVTLRALCNANCIDGVSLEIRE